MNLTRALREDVLNLRFGTRVIDRGRPYARGGMIHNVRRDVLGPNRIEFAATAVGEYDYDVTLAVTLADSGEVSTIVGRCSCPVGLNCKHAAALALVARGMGTAAPVKSGWMDSIQTLLAEFGPAEESSDHPGLALEVTISEAGRYSTERSVRFRPLREGKRENWVKTQAGWRDLAAGAAAYPPGQLAALLELSNAAKREYWSQQPDISWSEIDGRLHSLLVQVVASGVVLVPGPGLRSIELAEAAADVVLDVAAAEAGHQLLVGIDDGDQVWHGPKLLLAGSPAHTAGFLDAGILRMAPLARPAPAEVVRLIRQAPLEVGDAETAELSAMVAAVGRRIPVRTDGSLDVAELPSPVLRATVRWQSSSAAELGWEWAYGARTVALDATPDPLRDLAAERKVRDRVDPTWARMTTVTDAAALDLALRVLPALAAIEGVEVAELDRPVFRESDEAPEIRFEADGGQTGVDWLDLTVVIEFEGQRIGLPDVLEALTSEQEYLVLDGGLYVRTDRPELARLREVVRAAAELRERTGDGISVGTHDLGVWAELAALGVVDAQAAEWVAKAVALRDLESLPSPELVGLRSTLRHYQVDGFRWLAFLYAHGLGGVLADDMGLGKTLQVLALITRAVADAVDAPFLVVAPTSVVSAWREQVLAHAPDLRVCVVGGRGDEIDRDVDLVVTTYTVARLRAEEFQDASWSGLILDEAQHVKNHQSKTYAAVRRIPADFRLAVTGTPFENRLIELWALLSLTNPGLYPWPKTFVQHVAKPVAAGDEDALRRFRVRIRPFMLRRTKERVAAELPPKQEQVLLVDLNAKHRKVYETHLAKQRQKVLGLIEDFDRNRVAIFSALTTLRQLALDPALVDAELEHVGSAKIDLLLDHLVEVVAEGHQALVFSQFTSYLTRVRARLEAEGLRIAYLDGRTRDRAGAIASFRTGEADVFLISLKAGGVGLTLTEASYVYVLDPWWNPAAEAQAVDRAHRIGQTKSVNVYRLVSAGTIEEKVMELKARKAELFAQVMDGEGALANAISVEDVRGLFD